MLLKVTIHAEFLLTDVTCQPSTFIVWLQQMCLELYMVSKTLWTVSHSKDSHTVFCCCVLDVYVTASGWTGWKVFYTAAEVFMTVLTVGSRLRKSLNWSFMFVFTLVQSRTHVDTVQSVLHGLTNSRHICWSHTMKVVGWHVTFVRRNSAAVVTLSCISVDMKVWSFTYVIIIIIIMSQFLLRKIKNPQMRRLA